MPFAVVAIICLLIPHSHRGTAQQGAEWGFIKSTNPLFSTAFDATFDKLQLTRTTLISKMKKNFTKIINYTRIDIFHQKGYWLKIRMEFLRPILAKIKLICQQPQVSGAHPSSGVPERMTRGWWGDLAMNVRIKSIWEEYTQTYKWYEIWCSQNSLRW